MLSFLHNLERKPLGLSVLALLLSLPLLALASLPAYSGPPVKLAFGRGTVVLCCLALGVSFLAMIALIRAEPRGYSSTRIGLSVTALFFALVPVILFAVKLISLSGQP